MGRQPQRAAVSVETSRVRKPAKEGGRARCEGSAGESQGLARASPPPLGCGARRSRRSRPDLRPLPLRQERPRSQRLSRRLPTPP
eukprot:7528190-Alexandrium_andersonii.AAC.1